MLVCAIGAVVFFAIKGILWVNKISSMPTVTTDGYVIKIDEKEETAYIVRFVAPQTKVLHIKPQFSYKGKSYRTHYILDGAFAERKDIKAVFMPDGIICIGSGAFKNCDNLRMAVLPKYLMEIEREAFSGCRNLKYIEIPSYVDEIQTETFEGCSNLSYMVFHPGYNLDFRDVAELWSLPIKTIVLGRECYHWDRRTGKSYRVLANLETLETLILCDADFDIDANLLPSSGFSDCQNLKYIYCLNPKPYSLGMRTAFDQEHYENVTVKVRKGALSEYKQADTWKLFKHFEEFEIDTLTVWARMYIEVRDEIYNE